YQFDTLIPWGTPIQPGGPSYDGTGERPTADEQLEQTGLGHDGMWFFPMGRGNDEGMLAINHEYGTNFHVFGEDREPISLEEVRRSQHVHGVSVVKIKKMGGQWQVVSSPNARRITPNTPVTFSGPVANSDLLKNKANSPTLGTVNNCANGYTPWGTYLTCEENFNGYFGDSTYDPETETGSWTPTEAQSRYGFSPTGFGYGWYTFDPRFDLSNPDYVNEENRFGWVVEIDPMDGSQIPVKRTALGRCKHEGVALAIGRGGRAVAYMGDDERFDYIYKFVSESNWRSMQARGISPLDRGVLYAARFNDDGRGDWVELSMNNPDVAAKFNSQEEVLTFARMAADAAGATPMDRPEWTTVAPDGKVYCALTNNTRRKEPNPANPIVETNEEGEIIGNPNGHIIQFLDDDNHVGTTFSWNIFVIASDTQGDGDETSFSSPDGLWADPEGRLFIETDGGQPKGLNDQMLVANTATGEIRRMFTGVAGCEVTGITVTPDRRTMFINLQHPGDGDPAVTNFPAPFTGASGPVPRDATVVITRKDGGIIGS
ncbi:phosphatase, partial [filamentous cyanobacterium CCP5]